MPTPEHHDVDHQRADEESTSRRAHSDTRTDRNGAAHDHDPAEGLESPNDADPTGGPGPMGGPESTGSDESDREQMLRFVEQLALLLNEAGMARMTSRVLAYVLADDSTSHTARELADGLQVSPAAISGAVRQLIQAGFLVRERSPGARIDHYRLSGDDIWASITLQRSAMLKRYQSALAEGVDLLGPGRPGSRRIEETLEYFRFADRDLSDMVERWQAHRARWLARIDDDAGH